MGRSVIFAGVFKIWRRVASGTSIRSSNKGEDIDSSNLGDVEMEDTSSSDLEGSNSSWSTEEEMLTAIAAEEQP